MKIKLRPRIHAIIKYVFIKKCHSLKEGENGTFFILKLELVSVLVVSVLVVVFVSVLAIVFVSVLVVSVLVVVFVSVLIVLVSV